ncbi:LysR family transcriptional regulator [Saccharopolyspora karakumensis]|uniref:LysR family transcriptional regulator n=2 Tax=Saccharopolyspora TaxID=1835 RepID=A0A4R5BJE4_9PSEU|nr:MULTISPECIES: LysR family transcriptional regulator [Saccharopolyspora]MEB3366650.1 LysR family transcriptional regulator [Saccharopolyspora sp. S2-29]TDD85443.1 LysR family transcriptional regulator [Saccharopolyspora karakumensis]
MLIRQLEYLTALARERHFARAAETCYISQPALSTAIRKLEADLHVPIIQRGNRFLGFTPEGERILQWAYRILAERDSLVEDVGVMREGLSGCLRIGSVPTALNVLPVLTALLSEAQPRIRFSVRSMTSAQIQRDLSNYELDVGVTYVDNEPLSRVRSMPLYRERYLLLVGDDALAGRSSVTWQEAAEVPLCLLSGDMQNRRILDSIFEEVNARPVPAVEADSITALRAYVEEGRCATVLPQSWVNGHNVAEGMRAIPLVEPEATQTIGLVIHDRDPEPILARALLDVAGGMDLQSTVDLASRTGFPIPGLDEPGVVEEAQVRESGLDTGESVTFPVELDTAGD